MLCRVVSCCGVLLCVVLCCVVLCCAVSCRVVLHICFVLLILFDYVFIVQLESRKIEMSHTTMLLSKQRLLPESHKGRFRGAADRTNLLPFFSYFRKNLQEKTDTEHRYLLHVPRPNPLPLHPRQFINCGFGPSLSLSEFLDLPLN